MKIFFPQNIFSRLIAANLPPQMRGEVMFLPSAVLTNELKKHNDSVALIPTTDIIKNNELFVSSSYGMSFEGSLCNSYIYYSPSQSELKEIYLSGDVSSIEAILCKILFQEMYDASVDVKIITNEARAANQNLILTGDKNFTGGKYLSGISFAEEMIETLSLPFVNYVFASQGKEYIKLINKNLKNVGDSIYDGAETANFGQEFSEEAKNYIKENISSLLLDFTEQDVEGINQIIRLPYFHGMIEDIVEVKYV